MTHAMRYRVGTEDRVRVDPRRGAGPLRIGMHPSLHDRGRQSLELAGGDRPRTRDAHLGRSFGQHLFVEGPHERVVLGVRDHCADPIAREREREHLGLAAAEDDLVATLGDRAGDGCDEGVEPMVGPRNAMPRPSRSGPRREAVVLWRADPDEGTVAGQCSSRREDTPGS
jgi:hypothetical protein